MVQYLHDASLPVERRSVYASYVVQKGIASGESMRDEIYVQLCSQSMGSLQAGKTDPVWILMAACLSAFPPSAKLAKYLLK